MFPGRVLAVSQGKVRDYVKASPDDWIDLRTVKSPDEVLEGISAPHTFCCHCDMESNRRIGWERSRCEIGEWFTY